MDYTQLIMPLIKSVQELSDEVDRLKKEIEELKLSWNKDYNFEFIPVLNMEPEESGWTGGRGMVTDYFEEKYIREKGLEISDWQGYLCGPPPMVDAACQLLEKHGINSDEIFYDKFTDSSNL